MRKAMMAVFTAVIISALAAPITIAETPWFDMANCEFCKPLMEDPNLMSQMDWEHHIISDGIMSVTTVKDDGMPSFKKAMAKMGDCAAKMQKGEKVSMCSMCSAYSGFFAKGAKSENIYTNHGAVSLLTSTDPKIVAEIQEWAKKTNMELEKMAQMEHGKMEGKK